LEWLTARAELDGHAERAECLREHELMAGPRGGGIGNPVHEYRPPRPDGREERQAGHPGGQLHVVLVLDLPVEPLDGSRHGGPDAERRRKGHREREHALFVAHWISGTGRIDDLDDLHLALFSDTRSL